MNDAYYVAATGLQAHEAALQTHANNIANINTPGFKRSEVRFAELAAVRAEPAAFANSAAPGSFLLGVRAIESARVFEQGELRRTDNPLDLAIDGVGFIEVLGPNGQTFLSRGGRLRIDADGQLAIASGLPLKALASLQGVATGVAIDAQGVVRATFEGEPNRVIGRIELVTVRDSASLRSAGDGLYEAEGADLVAAAEPGADGAGVFVQGAIEGSNVRISDEMVTLLLMQRTFAANAQAIQAADQLMAIANGLMK